jgi:hypothetical protein
MTRLNTYRIILGVTYVGGLAWGRYHGVTDAYLWVGFACNVLIGTFLQLSFTLEPFKARLS